MIKRMGVLLLGLLSVAPWLFFAAFFFWLIPAFFVPSSDGAEESLFSQRFDQLEPFAIGTSILIVVLAIVFVAVIGRRDDVTIAEKVAVPVAIIATNGIVLPLVFWLYIWRRSNLASFSRRSAV